MDHSLKCLFIGGTGRSGSNVLRARLAEHSQIASLPFETRFTVDPDGVLATYRALCQGPTPFEAQFLLRRLENLLRRVASKGPMDRAAGFSQKALKAAGIRANLRRYADWELDRHIPGFSNAADRFLEAVTSARYNAIWPGRTGFLQGTSNRLPIGPDSELDAAFSGFLDECLSAITAKDGADAVVDDNTYNLFFASELTQLLPGAHLIHVVRDPRDVVASLMKQRWAPSELVAAIRFYENSVSAITRQLHQVPEDRFSVVLLEDLAKDPYLAMKNLYASVGLIPERRFGPEDFSKANSGRWRMELDVAQQRRITAELEHWIGIFGYDA